MTDQTRAIQEIFYKRITLVGEISSLNAEQLQITQQLSGNQFDILRCQDGLSDRNPSQQLRSELAEAEAREADLQNQIDECNERLQALENEIAALDRLLADL